MKLLKWLLPIIVSLIAYAATEWLIVCGVIKLITMLVNVEFSWAIATAVFLALKLVSVFVKGDKKK